MEKSYRLAWITAFVILAGLFLYRLLLIFSYNGEIGGIDNNFVYDVTRAIGGHSIYTDPASPPYAITLYSPLYFTICTAIGKLFHINPDDPIQVYQLCRAISLICDILTCFLLCRLLKRSGVSKELSWLSVAVFACILCFLGYTFSRADSLLLVFYAATLYVLSNPLPVRVSRIAVLVLLSVGCILSKQNGIALPLLITVWLLLTNTKKISWYYRIAFIVGIAAALLLYASIYPHFFSNTILALQNGIDLSWFYTDIFKRMMNSLWMLPLYIAFILAIRNRKGPDKAWSIIFLTQLLFSFATSLKWGSTAGYFNECFFLSLIVITQSLKTASGDVMVKKGVVFFLPLLVLFFIHTIAQGYLFFIQNRSIKKTAYEQQKEIRNYLQPKLQGHYVLDLADANRDFFKTIFYKEIAVPNMDIVGCCTLPDQTFDYSMLKQDLSNGNISYLISYGERPASVWGVSLDRFTRDTALYGYTIYRFQ